MNRFKQTGPAEAGFAIGDALSSIGQTIQARRERQRQLESRGFMQAALGNVGQFETREEFFEDIFKKIQVGTQQGVDITPTINVASTFAGLIPSAATVRESKVAEAKEKRLTAQFDKLESETDKKNRIDINSSILLDKDSTPTMRNTASKGLMNDVKGLTIEEISTNPEMFSSIPEDELYRWSRHADIELANYALVELERRTGTPYPRRTAEDGKKLLRVKLPNGITIETTRGEAIKEMTASIRDANNLMSSMRDKDDPEVIEAFARAKAFTEALGVKTEEEPVTESLEEPPEGIPEGSKKIGKTPAGFDIYETPDGKKLVYEP